MNKAQLLKRIKARKAKAYARWTETCVESAWFWAMAWRELEYAYSLEVES